MFINPTERWKFEANYGKAEHPSDGNKRGLLLDAD